MADPLASIRTLVHCPADAIRWACLLEATAPKAGNVYPGREFANLKHIDFVAAAEICANHIGDPKRAVSQRMLVAIQETVSLTKTNVNLGIVLLLGPLVAADEAIMSCESALRVSKPTEPIERNDVTWRDALTVVLKNLTLVDGENILNAIQQASAGGLGKVEEMDVNDSAGPIDIVTAMKAAADRDRIARQYAGNFIDLIENVVPVIWDSIDECGDVLAGISRAHLTLLSREMDSLILRKNGEMVAQSVQKRAQKVDPSDPASLAKFDASLRSNTHKLNPGTTADLIAAGLYVLLRT